MPWILPCGAIVLVAASAPLLGGCGHRDTQSATANRADPPTSPAGSVPEIDGAWTEPIDGFEIVDLVATDDALLVGGRVGLRPAIRSARWLGGALAVGPVQPVPPPASKGGRWDDAMGQVDPALAVDRTTSGLAITRVEYQGGAWGIVVYRDPRSPAFDEIEPITGESDIGFGRPLVLGRDELVTDDADRLLHYRRRDGRWSASVLGIRSDAWHLAWSLDRNTLVASTVSARERLRTGSGAPADDPASLVVMTRTADGSFARASEDKLPGEASGLAFSDATLVVGFTHPAVDGTGIWLFEPPYDHAPRHVAIPVARYCADRDCLVAVNALDAAGGLALAAQADALWAIEVPAGKVTCRLGLPARRDGRDPRPLAVVWGSRAAVAVDNRIGVYDLSRCRGSSRL